MEAAAELMGKEGGALADRPRMVAVNIVSGGMRLILRSSGDLFCRLRRAVHTHLQPKAAASYEEIQAETAKDLIFDVLNDPKLRMQHAERGAYLVDTIPLLKHVPGYGRKLKEFHRYELGLFREQMDRVRNDIATNRAGPSFVKTLLENVADHRLSNDEMAYLAGTFFGAGSGSTAAGITVMIMAAAFHPDAQARVQEELDEVAGKNRIPTFGDRDMLPQLQAFVLEALRWRPLGFAHRAAKDIVWRGWCIPAGSTIMGCHWAISRDPAVFPDPEMFNPGRWLSEDGRIRTDVQFYTYGFGRRLCPGQHVGDRSFYITLAYLLWSFRILQRVDAPIDTYAGKVPDTLLFLPKPFDVEFVPSMEVQRLRELMA